VAQDPEQFGANAWLVEEMYEAYRADPDSVSEAWQEFFVGYRPEAKTASAPVAAAPATAPSATPSTSAPAAPAAPAATPTPSPTSTATDGEPIRGVAAVIAANMASSLEVPTATSFRDIPAKLLEVNRKVINGYRERSGKGKVSFTHLIGFAVVRAIVEAVPNMNNGFSVVDGKPVLHRRPHVNMGLAVDVDKGDGTRTLVVPVLRDADTLHFDEFLKAYEDLIRKVKTNKLAVTDFQGATMTLTNPGTIGTVQSVPRLMQGQGVIVGVGTIDYPAEFEGADQKTLADMGVSKIVTITSTYDHRIIQGAESGLFLRRVHELLLGDHGFYDSVFASLGVPYEAVRWRQDVSPLNRDEAMLQKQMAVATLIRAHRVRGHLIADLDPLRWKPPRMHDELDPFTYGLTIWDLDREFLTGGVGGRARMPLGELLGVMRDAYCRTIGVEYMHIQETEEQRWLQQRLEGVKVQPTKDEQRYLLERLNAAEAFEAFLARKYVGTKRFGLEGAEAAIVVLDAVLSSAADAGLDSAVIGMAHRGRLNVLANIVGKSYEQIFKEFEGHIDPGTVQGSGDVKYHLGASGKFVARSGADLQVELAANPSHLETVDPIVLGIARAKQDLIEPPGSFPVLPLLIHGDAAFSGQGVVAECLAMSEISGYRVGGTVHLIINNQIGFTTAPEYSRSSQYCSDVAKTVQAPIFHVNGDDPEACLRVARLAFEFRQRFHKDVVIDMVCYRRHGHNEGDDPSYTQPLMYKAIAQHRSVRNRYVEQLVTRGDFSTDEAEAMLKDFQEKRQRDLDVVRAQAAVVKAVPPHEPQGVLDWVETGVERAKLDRVFDQLTAYPEGFTPHPKLVRLFEQRASLYYEQGTVDWATAESLAFGSLLLDGSHVRLSGEDSRRGTFSQRHATLVDYENGSTWTPLAHLSDSAHMWVYDSLLSEYAVVGFEYGYAHANPEALVLWEAQFGDFTNGAQIIIDQYLVAAEDKWGQFNGLTMLLPHGYEGQGPEHSSARIERFLGMCAEDNIQVCNATTAAQYFHLLRRQMKLAKRRPLVVFTPKAPLRMKQSQSRVEELTSGHFWEVLDDPWVPVAPEDVRRLVFCSGKVAWDAFAVRDERKLPVAVIRLEQLYPFPQQQMLQMLQRYPNAKQLFWLQEEPENMGPWNFMEHRSWRIKEQGYEIHHRTRVESGSPATGSKTVHDQELAELMESTFAGL
jgi:2-oxoglutarate dehydrogenase E1 component